MSRMLDLIHAGWTSARVLAHSGRRAEARAQVGRLLARPDLPAAVAANAHRLAAELAVREERYRDARRHLRAAIGLEPKNARAHYLAGLAHERDEDGDDYRAAVRFREASRLEPGNSLYRASFGRAAIRCDRVKTGTRELLAVADRAADNPAVIEIAVEGLLEAGKVRAAHRVVVKARFRCPGHATIRKLWERVRFAMARSGQKNTPSLQEARFATEGVLEPLPFVRVVDGESRSPRNQHARRDVISLHRPHFPRFLEMRADY